MKITKSQLQNIIKEELGKIREFERPGEEAGTKMSRGEMAKAHQALSRGKASIDPGARAVTGGVTDEERAAITQLSQRMLKAAGAGNLVTGAIAKLVQKLNMVLDQAIGSGSSPGA